jgi:probable rRNA maturation factor
MKPMSRIISILAPENIPVLATNLTIDIQRVSQIPEQPNDDSIQHWVQTALQLETLNGQLELCIRIVDEAEISTLNAQYRHRNGSTNVLSFPAEVIPEMTEQLLGDLVICTSVVNHEAQLQNKTIDSHWAHMVIHGVLHLCGYDHINEQDAQRMESRELFILNTLGFSNPYEVK